MKIMILYSFLLKSLLHCLMVGGSKQGRTFTAPVPQLLQSKQEEEKIYFKNFKMQMKYEILHWRILLNKLFFNLTGFWEKIAFKN